MKRFMQLILGAFFLLTSSTTFASGVYASFRNSEDAGQTFTAFNQSLSFPSVDVNVGGGITKQAIGGGNTGDQFIVNIPGDYLIISTVNDINISVSGTIVQQFSFDMTVNGIEQDRLTTNTASSIILPLKEGDVIQFDLVGGHNISFPLTLLSRTGTNQTETNTSTLTFVKLDGTAAGISTCPGGLH